MNMLILIIGPSGSGKTTLEKQLLEHYSNFYERIISHTTRPMRKSEENGVDYYFVSPEKFNKMEKEEAFVEVVNFLGNKYGCSVNELMSKKKNILLVVEPNGMEQILKKLNSTKELREKYYPVIIYMDIDKKQLVENMKKRGDSEEKIKERLNDKINEKFKEKNILPYITVRKTYPSLFKDVHNQLMLYQKLFEINLITKNR